MNEDVVDEDDEDATDDEGEKSGRGGGLMITCGDVCVAPCGARRRLRISWWFRMSKMSEGVLCRMRQ